MVVKDSVRRSVDVVGTLAAEDQVTISSEAEGTVAPILADLGDRVKAGQVLVELDREKLQYNLEQQQAALARALAQYGAADPEHLPADRADARRAEGGSRARAGASRRSTRADELHQAQRSSRSRRSTTRTRRCSRSRPATTRRCRTRGTCAPTSTPRRRAMKLAERQLRDTEIRAPFDGYVQKRLVSPGRVREGADAGHDHRPDRSAEGDRRRFPSGWRRGSSVGQPVELRVDAYPRPDVHRQGVAHQPGREPRRRARSRSKRSCRTPTAALKPGTFARVHIETARVDEVLTLPVRARCSTATASTASSSSSGDRLAARELKIGDRLGDRIEILERRRSAGDRVAVDRRRHARRRR